MEERKLDGSSSLLLPPLGVVDPPDVEVLHVDVPVGGSLPLAPQQQTLLSRGLWRRRERCISFRHSRMGGYCTMFVCSFERVDGGCRQLKWCESRRYWRADAIKGELKKRSEGECQTGGWSQQGQRLHKQEFIVS